ncbi:MAG: TIGR00282 family metallophosphoesterase [Nitrospirota bacterium]|nr:TIGR00282 family metallophosphoesterase [Nitrospirota bacterium]
MTPPESGLLNILMIGDIVGEPGRKAVFRHLDRLRDEYRLDLVIGNGENAAGGFGITHEVARELYRMGLDVITTGNHAWDKPEALDLFREEKRLLRPANYPEGTPGSGSGLFTTASGHKVGVVQVMGRVFMHALDCPFRAATREVNRMRRETPVVIVDVHAEASSEKMAMGWHLDGIASSVSGSHTHVQTADARLLPGGTGYLTDVGMTGPMDGVIGMRKDAVLARFLSGMPKRLAVASGPAVFSGAVFSIEPASGRCQRVERVYLPDV